MTDPLRKVRPSEKWEPSAAAHNAFVEAVEYIRRLQGSEGATPDWIFWQAAIVPIKNGSGFDRNQFDVLGIDDVFPTPTSNLNAFKAGPILHGVTPATSHAGKFAILLEPAANGKIVRCCAAGICRAKVDVSDTSHLYAEVKNGDAGSLQSVLKGSARILWQESGTGVKWALIRFGVEVEHQARWIEFVVNDASGFSQTDASVTVDGVLYHDGYQPSTPVTTVYNKSASSNYMFKGDDNDKGIALFDRENQKYIINQMECP